MTRDQVAAMTVDQPSTLEGTMTKRTSGPTKAMGPALAVSAVVAGISGMAITWVAQGVATSTAAPVASSTIPGPAVDQSKAAQLKAQIRAARAQLAAGTSPSTTQPLAPGSGASPQPASGTAGQAVAYAPTTSPPASSAAPSTTTPVAAPPTTQPTPPPTTVVTGASGAG